MALLLFYRSFGGRSENTEKRTEIKNDKSSKWEEDIFSFKNVGNPYN